MKKEFLLSLIALLIFSYSILLAADDGAAVYKGTCLKCHGELGKGDGPASKMFKQGLGDLSSKAGMAKYSDEDLQKLISEGGPAIGKSKVMAPQKGKLTDAQIRALVAYVKGLQK
ncbi:MAG: cytochrome c [Acidobacteria bacterium]|nr:cytochrome c [Acidobacteriota bacterium]